MGYDKLGLSGKELQSSEEERMKTMAAVAGVTWLLWSVLPSLAVMFVFAVAFTLLFNSK